MSPHTQGSLRHMSPPPLYPYEVETDHLIALSTCTPMAEEALPLGGQTGGRDGPRADRAAVVRLCLLPPRNG